MPPSPQIGTRAAQRQLHLSAALPRLAAFGVSVLNDAEIVALTLGTRADPDLGRRVLDAVGTPHGLLSRRMNELACIPGAGPKRAQRLLAALELGRRATATIDPGRALMTADDVAQRMARLKSEVVEVFVAIGVNARNRVVGEWEIARGWESGVNLTPRQVMTLLVKAPWSPETRSIRERILG